MIQQATITGVRDPNYGAEIADLWFKIRDNPDTPDWAWREISHEVYLYGGAVSYMRRILDPMAIYLTSQPKTKDEEVLHDDIRALEDTVSKIALEVESATGVSCSLIEDSPIEKGVLSGLRYASLLLRNFVPQPEPVGEAS